MPRLLNTTQAKTSWALFQGLFIVAALLAASATFVAVSGVSPANPTDGGMLWLLGVNMILIAVLARIVVQRYLHMRRAAEGPAPGRLVQRFLLLFSLSAILPAGIVAIFLGATITAGLDNWFGERVDTIVEETASVARDTVDGYIDALETDTLQAKSDFDETVENGLETEFLTAQVAIGTFFAAYLVDGEGRLVNEARAQDPLLFRKPSDAALEEAQSGAIAQTLYERVGLATALAKANTEAERYLYFYREFDPQQIAQLRRAEQALIDLREAEGRSDRLQWLFAVGYAQIAALILLLSGRFGLEAAGQITGPIGRLATAAHSVRDGDLTVRVGLPAGRDELYALTQSFNGMTEQLAEQRNALITAREDSEDRRQFVETLLAEVSAGIIRTDAALVISLANRSAQRLLGVEFSAGDSLQDIASEFAPYAISALSHGAPVDTSLEIKHDGLVRHFRLKTALDPAGGCVLTFDETTGLVNAQRQLAWRDVARRIAHEIRNPLTPIQLSTERLRRRYLNKIEDDDGVFERCLDTILRQVGDIGRMVEEFSNFARMPKPTIAPFHLGALLERTGFAQGMVSPELKIEVQGVDKAPEYRGDERLLGQAFGNLIKNAVQAIETRPEEDETPGYICVLISASPEAIDIEIEDNGPGFPEEARDKLLEPYVTTKEKGSGLGLAIVNRIIMDHGGSISLQNRTDGLGGARVAIHLPVEPADTELIDADDASGERLEDVHV